MKNIRIYIAILALLSFSSNSNAAIVSEGANLTGGGGATWSVFTDFNFDGTTRFGIQDANIAGQFDAYDGGVTLSVNGTFYTNPGSTYDLTGSTITSNAQTLSGLSVFVEHFAVQTDPTLRSIFNFSNTTGSEITASISYQSNTGADGSQTTIATSSGDTAFTTSDRWITTDDFSPTSGDPTLNHVLFGTGSPTSTPGLVSNTVFSAAGTQGVRADYSITVGAGDTLSLMFFNQLWGNPTLAAAGASVFDNNSSLESAGYLDGLSASDLSAIANWDINNTVPEPTSMALFGLGTLGMGVIARRRKKQQLAA